MDFINLREIPGRVRGVLRRGHVFKIERGHSPGVCVCAVLKLIDTYRRSQRIATVVQQHKPTVATPIRGFTQKMAYTIRARTNCGRRRWYIILLGVRFCLSKILLYPMPLQPK